MNYIKVVKNKRKSLLRSASLLIIIFIVLSCAHKSEKVDLIIHNAKIYTVDNSNSIQEAIAIHNGKIVEVGPEFQIRNKYKADQIIDAQKKPVYPGFIDSHCHFLGYGLSLQKIDLVGTKSFQEVLNRVQEYQIQPGQLWIQGRGWDQNNWEIKEFPTKEKLDSLLPNTPIILRRIDGHAAIVNQKALDLANITTDSKVENGTFIIHNGELTGVLIDGAVDQVLEVIPQPSTLEKEMALYHAQQNCIAVGLTTVDDCGISKSEVYLLDSLYKNDKLSIRIYAMLSDNNENFNHFLQAGPYQTERLNASSFKFFADGALGSRGAALIAPYSDQQNNSGYILKSKEYFQEMGQKVFDAGFQMNTHCIGDSANRLILDVYSNILKTTNDARWRIEHAQVVTQSDISKFKNYSIIPSIQPTHATSDMRWAEDRLGPDRVKTAYAYRALKNQIGLVALGTDFPVEGINPIETFYSAVFRKNVDGYPQGGFQIENALTRDEALKGMTIWGAIANKEEKFKGSLEKGKFADLVILDRDIMTVEEDYILDTKVVYTIIDGKVVYH